MLYLFLNIVLLGAFANFEPFIYSKKKPPLNRTKMSEAAFSGICHIINIYIFLNIQRNLIKVLS